MTARTFVNAQACLALRSLILPVLCCLTDVSLVADLCHLLGLGKELLGLVRISLLDREVTNLTKQEVVEVLPVRLLRVEAEWVLAFLSQSGVVAPQVPGLELARFARRRTALNSLLLLSLALTHTALGLQTVVDTWSVGDDDEVAVGRGT